MHDIRRALSNLLEILEYINADLESLKSKEEVEQTIHQEVIRRKIQNCRE